MSSTMYRTDAMTGPPRVHGAAMERPRRGTPAEIPGMVELAGPRAHGRRAGAGVARPVAMSRNSHRWARVGRWIMAAFVVAVVVLLVRYARNVEWGEVAAAVGAYEAGTVVIAAALAALSFALYGSYDLAARAYVGHRLTTWRVLLIAFVSYAFNLNLGALVGGAGFRVRLYSRSGLRLADIGRVIAFSVATNWLGYVLLAGAVFAAGFIAPPEDWKI